MSLYSLIFRNLIIFILSVLSVSLTYAEAVNQTISEPISAPPVERGKKTKKNIRKRIIKKRKSPNQATADIVPSLYLTFGLMMLLPLFVLTGLLMVGVGFPALYFLYTGIALVALGNGAAAIAGILAGANKTYSTQILSFALWVLFGINMAGAITFLILNLVLFSSTLFIWGLVIGLFCIAILMLVWALAIRKQNKALRNNADEG
ncbi:hypothetical protein [Aureispira anguillae]|uniref:Uncharacterized protein n=1 Tax=Aureispira anguillae TaxID=2864201 RepID=A0A915YM39_9BACT|nr:hypothetical protein [Aureispira anguillae]BDS15615.1 hypothetical protein AsAng_0063990 [Aureispira anguillae]